MKVDEYKRRVTAYLRSGKATDEDWDLVATLIHDASECECFFSPAMDDFHQRVFGEPVVCPKCGGWVTPGFWCPGCDEWEAPEVLRDDRRGDEVLLDEGPPEPPGDDYDDYPREDNPPEYNREGDGPY